MNKSIIVLVLVLFLFSGCAAIKDKDENENVIEEIDENKESIESIEQENQATEITVLDSSEAIEKSNPEPLTVEDKLKASDYYISQHEKDYLEYYKLHKDKSLEEIIINVNMGLDYGFYNRISVSDNPALTNVLCNKYNAIPEEYTPEDLVTVPSVYHINDGKEYLIAERLLEAYELMYQAAIDQEVDLSIASAYRTYSFQEYLYDKYSKRHGKEKADTFSARPGHSEHETGLAIDFYPIRTSFEETESFSWLMNNAYQYGFILRYPNDKEDITGYKYEPWHFRYVGKDISEIIYKEEITYDEYYAKYILPIQMDIR